MCICVCVRVAPARAEVCVHYLLQKLLVGHRLACIEDHQDQRARPRCANHTLTATFAVFRALDDARQIQLRVCARVRLCVCVCERRRLQANSAEFARGRAR